MTPLGGSETELSQSPSLGTDTLIATGLTSRLRLHGSMAERKLFSGDERPAV